MADWSGLPTLRIAANVGAGYVPEYWEATIVPEAMERFPFRDGAEVFPRLGLGNGESYHLTLGGTMAAAGTLAIGTKTPVDATYGYRHVNGTMREWGRGVAIQRRLLQLSPMDPQNTGVRNELTRNMNRAINGLLRDALMGATTNRVNGGTYGRTGGGTHIIFGTYANGKMTDDAVRKTAEQLMAENVPEFPQGGWLFAIHPFQLSDLFSDDTAVKGFVPRVQYVDKGFEAVSKFEIGMWYNMRLVPTTLVTGTKEQAATGTVDTARAVAWGPLGVGFVIGELPRITVDEDYEKDFGRVTAIAWHANLDGIRIKDAYAVPCQTTVSRGITVSGIA